MHPENELRKRLRERFASYEPEPETSWQDLEIRLANSPKPVRRKRRVVAVILLTVLFLGGIGFWINEQKHLWSLEKTSKAIGIISKLHFASTEKSPTKVNKQLQANNLRPTSTAPTITQPRLTDPAAINPTRRILNTTIQITKRPNLLVSKSANAAPLEPYSVKNEPSFFENPSFSTNDLLKSKIETMNMLNARQPRHLEIGILPPHLPISPATKELNTNKPTRPQPTWVLKAGPLLGYSVMNSVVRENNSALSLENLRSSLPRRLGWHLYIARQQPLSHGRQLEIGAVFRQFGQGIRYQVPTGAYSVVVQPDRSATVTQLRDTLSDQFTVRQAGMRLGYKTPLLPQAGLYGGVGGELMYQFNRRDIAVNAEVNIGKTLTAVGSRKIMIELFVNTAIRSVYDSQGWVRVLPYHVGLRVGVPLGVK